jgi:hypothetical protein
MHSPYLCGAGRRAALDQAGVKRTIVPRRVRKALERDIERPGGPLPERRTKERPRCGLCVFCCRQFRSEIGPGSSLAARRAVRLPEMLPLLVAVSCAQGKLLPAASAHVVPGAPEAAAEEIQGLRVSADGDDWTGPPVDLSTRLTPVKVRIVNHSGAPAVIEYERFRLIGGHGHVYRAIPPIPVDHRTPLDRVGTIVPVYAASNFYVAPRLHDIYPTLAAWSRPLARDEGAPSTGLYRLWSEDLPTRAMQRMSLPEGVLADGGEISGFLFFENATKRESRLIFRADIDDEEHGDRLAKIEIPFRVQ